MKVTNSIEPTVVNEDQTEPQSYWYSLFAVLWGMAILFHLFGDFQTISAWSTLKPVPLFSVMTALAAVVLVATRREIALGIMAVLQIIVFWLAFPQVSNHWIVTAAVNAGILAALGMSWRGGWKFDQNKFWKIFAPTGRWTLVAFYSFAAFAKWNSDFFDPAVSCGVLLAQISASSFGLSSLMTVPFFQWTAIVGSWAIESAVPILLVFRRTRYWGALLGITFHFVLAVDWVRHFYDFSSLLIALFILFLPSTFAVWVDRELNNRLGPSKRRLVEVVGLALITFLTAAPGFGIESLQVVAFILNQAIWYVYGGAIIWLIWRFGREESRVPETGMWRVRPLLLTVLPLLMVVNGLMAYGETRRGRGFDMYSNLRTFEGETNHWVLPAFSLTQGMSDPVVIVSTSAEDLDYYVDNDLAVSFLALRKYLSTHPDTAITLAYQGDQLQLARAADWPQLVEPLPWWQQKFMTFKPIDLRPSNRCFDQFRPLD